MGGPTPTTHDPARSPVSTRGQVSIGTLAVFVALVLVASLAAGVLINVAGVLAPGPGAASDDTRTVPSDRFDVVDVTGQVRDGTVSTLVLTVERSERGPTIDLTDATVEYVDDDSAVTLVYASGGASATEFATDGDLLESVGDRVQITVDVASIRGSGLPEGAEAQVRVVDESGATAAYGVDVPFTVPGDQSTIGV